RRRHTRSKRDWSSDVCSSDLTGFRVAPDASVRGERRAQLDLLADALEEHCDVDALLTLASGGVAPGLPGLTLRRSDRRDTAAPRSEERRVVEAGRAWMRS